MEVRHVYSGGVARRPKDFKSSQLRALARQTKDGPQARRVLALAAIYDGATRAEPVGGVTLRTIWDWVMRFNALGAAGLLDGKSPGHCNTDAMNLHLAEIAKAVAPGAHAVLLIDQAGWNLLAGLFIPANITIIPLPPKCPKSNPVKNIWQHMRDNWLSNRVFKSYDDIVDHCCYAWNTLVDRPWKIMSIGLRQWAHEF
jgi:hypothetical protein